MKAVSMLRVSIVNNGGKAVKLDVEANEQYQYVSTASVSKEVAKELLDSKVKDLVLYVVTK